MVFGLLPSAFSVARSGEVFLKKVGLGQALKDWQDLDVNVEGVIGKENILTNVRVRRHISGPTRKMTSLENIKLS